MVKIKDASTLDVAKQKKEDKIIISTLNVKFDYPVFPRDISKWRGKVAEAAGWEKNLFHNHQAEGAEKTHIIRYPQVHFRSVKGKAAIWATGDGVKAVKYWLFDNGKVVTRNGKEISLRVIDMYTRDYTIQISPTPITYRLHDWIAFNQENYQRWQQADDLIERTKIMNEVLEGQLLGFSKAMGYDLPERIEAKVLNIRSTKPVRVHNYQPMAFNILYRTNLVLPPHIALGRHKAFGFGVQMPVKNEPKF